jgi:hypothetical protein
MGLIVRIMLISIVVFQGAVAQNDSITFPRWELGGGFRFSVDTRPYSTWWGASEHRSYIWALQPEVAFFVTRRIEIAVHVSYQGIHEETDDQPGRYHDSVMDYFVSRELSVAIGPGYNVPLSGWACSFVRLKSGLSWTETEDQYLESSAPKWITPRIVFPIIQCGLRFFLSPGGAVVVQLQYARVASEGQTKLTYGLGYSVFL